jgi:hypothetical protein
MASEQDMTDQEARDYAIALDDDDIRSLAWEVTREVAELPDRTSPPDEPMMMLVTERELADILIAHLSARAALEMSGGKTPAPDPAEAMRAEIAALKEAIRQHMGQIDRLQTTIMELKGDAPEALSGSPAPEPAEEQLGEPQKKFAETFSAEDTIRANQERRERAAVAALRAENARLDAKLLHFSDVCNNREEQIDTLRVENARLREVLHVLRNRIWPEEEDRRRVIDEALKGISPMSHPVEAMRAKTVDKCIELVRDYDHAEVCSKDFDLGFSAAKQWISAELAALKGNGE